MTDVEALETMVVRSFRRSRQTAKAREIYGSIVAQARQPSHFTEGGVPDTLEGRLELLLLFIVVVLVRLQREQGDGPELAQALSETFVEDVDDNLREVGISDLKVPAKVKKAAAALLERHADYAGALAKDDGALEPAIARHFGALAHAGSLNSARLAEVARVYAAKIEGAGLSTIADMH